MIAHKIAQMEMNKRNKNATMKRHDLIQVSAGTSHPSLDVNHKNVMTVVHATPITHGMTPRTVTPTEHDHHHSNRLMPSRSPQGITCHLLTPSSSSLSPSGLVPHPVLNTFNSNGFHDMETDHDICHGASVLIGLANTSVSPEDVKSIATMNVHTAQTINDPMNKMPHNMRFVPSFRPSKDEKIIEFMNEYQIQTSNSMSDLDSDVKSFSTSDTDCGVSHDTSSSEDEVEEWYPSNTHSSGKKQEGNGSRSRSIQNGLKTQKSINVKRKVRSTVTRRYDAKHSYALKSKKRPNPHTTQISCSKETYSHKASEEVVLRSTQVVTNIPKKLALEQDEKMVNLLHCYVRSNLVEIVVCNRFDPSKKLYPGRVGLQCVYCKNAGDDKSRTSVVYPRSLALLYRAVCGWQRTHVTGDKANMPCENIPKDVMNHYQYCKDVDKTRGRVAYWEQSARSIGLRDSGGTGIRCEGIVFCKE